MQRSFNFREIDDVLLAALPSENFDKLKQINELEERLQIQINDKKRAGYAAHVEPEVRQKILRIFVHHVYFPETTDDKAHFKLFIEGTVLNECYQHLKFGSFFEQITVSVEIKDKRNVAIVPQVFEWKDEDFGSGADANTFQYKIYCDTKPCTAKIAFTRNDEVLKRYELSEKLREVLPLLRVDPTEEDIVLALWNYISDHNLWSEKDKKYVKCNEKLRDLFLVDSFIISSMKNKLARHMAPAKPIHMEHFLSPANTTDALLTNYKKIFSPHVNPNAAFAVQNINMRQFDIEVDVYDDHSLRYVAELNALMRREYHVTETLAKKYSEQVFLAQHILACQYRINSLQREAEQYATFHRIDPRSSTKRKRSAYDGVAADGSYQPLDDETEDVSDSTADYDHWDDAPFNNAFTTTTAAEDTAPLDLHGMIARRETPPHRVWINSKRKHHTPEHNKATEHSHGGVHESKASEETEEDLALAAVMSIDNLSSAFGTATTAPSTAAATETEKDHDNLTTTAAKPPTMPIISHPSTLHNCSGFLDVGDEDGLFSGKHMQWLDYLAAEIQKNKDMKMNVTDIKDESVAESKLDTSHDDHPMSFDD